MSSSTTFSTERLERNVMLLLHSYSEQANINDHTGLIVDATPTYKPSLDSVQFLIKDEITKLSQENKPACYNALSDEVLKKIAKAAIATLYDSDHEVEEIDELNKLQENAIYSFPYRFNNTITYTPYVNAPDSDAKYLHVNVRLNKEGSLVEFRKFDFSSSSTLCANKRIESTLQELMSTRVWVHYHHCSVNGFSLGIKETIKDISDADKVEPGKHYRLIITTTGCKLVPETDNSNQK